MRTPKFGLIFALALGVCSTVWAAAPAAAATNEARPVLAYYYAWWDPGGAAAVQAIKAKGKLKKIGVASQNGDCIQLGHVLKGEIREPNIPATGRSPSERRRRRVELAWQRPRTLVFR